MSNVSDRIIGVSSANGEIYFLKLDGSKEAVIKQLDTGKKKVSEIILWIPYWKYFVVSD